MRIDLPVARAMTHLQRAEMKPLVGYLKAQRSEALEQLAQAGSIEQVYRLQGEAGLLGKLLTAIEQADSLALKMQKK